MIGDHPAHAEQRAIGGAERVFGLRGEALSGSSQRHARAVHRDGALLGTYAGPLGSNDAKGPYWKEGIYRAAAPETLAAHFAGLAITVG